MLVKLREDNWIEADSVMRIRTLDREPYAGKTQVFYTARTRDGLQTFNLIVDEPIDVVAARIQEHQSDGYPEDTAAK